MEWYSRIVIGQRKIMRIIDLFIKFLIKLYKGTCLIFVFYKYKILIFNKCLKDEEKNVNYIFLNLK